MTLRKEKRAVGWFLTVIASDKHNDNVKARLVVLHCSAVFEVREARNQLATTAAAINQTVNATLSQDNSLMTIAAEKHRMKNKASPCNKYLICISANVSIYHSRRLLVFIRLSLE